MTGMAPLGDLLLTLIPHRRRQALYRHRISPGQQMAVPRAAARKADHPARLADRLRAPGLPAKAGRRAALTDLAARLPAAVLADLLGLHPTTAVN